MWVVLNLVINGLPSILAVAAGGYYLYKGVLNLVINGLPSILKMSRAEVTVGKKF